MTCKAYTCHNSTNYSWNDYCSYHERCLSKFREKESVSDSDIRKLETFETWFSELCGYVISAKGSNYVINFAFFEPKCRSMGEKLTTYNRTGEIYWLSDAESKATEIKWKLKGDNPILAFYDNSYHSISSYILVSPEVVKQELPNSGIGLNIPFTLFIGARFYLGNPDSYLKPLDIVKVEKTERVGNSLFSWTTKTYYHVCIYLGNDKVFHMWHPTWVSKMDAQIGSWSDFMSNATGPIYRYHTPVPFKHYKKVIEHIAKADWADLWYGKYDLWNRNCEHLANVCKYGINWSEQIEEASSFVSWWMKSQGGLKRAFNGESFLNENYVNNGMSSSIILKNEIERSTGRIEKVLRDKTSAERRETREDLEWRYRVEIPNKSDCKVM